MSPVFFVVSLRSRGVGEFFGGWGRFFVVAGSGHRGYCTGWVGGGVGSSDTDMDTDMDMDADMDMDTDMDTVWYIFVQVSKGYIS